MSLSPGTKLGPYVIESPLGAGGMGEVYRAKDTRLGRDVAVKILPAHLSQNPEVRERFEREARAISSLNHPHICTLYDIGREGDADYFVMELLDGESLATRLERGPVKLDEALKIAGQIADGLAAAHRQGIVHRDLKPGNIVLTKAGAKILDFGVAKLKEEQVVDMATRTTPLTSMGAMVGTVQYMAPEQLEGKPVDQRADLFAFGALLYEMVTGQRAFPGQSQASVIASILTTEPRPVSEVIPTSPAALDRVIKTCLAKDPEERWHGAGDLARELKWIAEGKPDPVAKAKRGSSREKVAWSAAMAFLLAAVVLAFRSPTRAEKAIPTTRFSVVPSQGTLEGPPVVSPDGRFIAYVLNPEAGNPGLWLHSLETGDAKPLNGTEGARQPFWSPDGKWIAFFAQGRLKKVALTGEPPVKICDAADARGGTWGSGGDILFSPTAASGLFRVSAAGGTPAVLTRNDASAGEQSHRMPTFLPDGKHYLYTASGSSDRGGVYWATLGDDKRKRLLPDITGAKYDERGYLVFRRGGALMAQGFDPDRGELRGDAAVIAADVGTDPQITAADRFSISRDGTLALRKGASEQMRLTWMDRTGKALGMVAPEHSLFEPAFSPDETHLAAGGTLAGATEGAVWIVDLRPGGQISRLTFGKREAETANFAPDGRSVVFSEPTEKGFSLARKSTDGTGEEETLVVAQHPIWADGVSPDGKFVICEQYEPETGSDLYLLRLDGSHEMVPYRKTANNETHATFSPDGRYVAYVSDEQGIADIFVETVPASGSRWQVSTGGGDQPAWRADGKALYYMNINRMLTEVEIKSTSPLTLGAQHPLFRLVVPTVSLTGPRTFFAVTRSADRFVVNTLVGDQGKPGFDVALNWEPPVAAK